jgi:hypothetical protein
LTTLGPSGFALLSAAKTLNASFDSFGFRHPTEDRYPAERNKDNDQQSQDDLLQHDSSAPAGFKATAVPIEIAS